MRNSESGRAWWAVAALVAVVAALGWLRGRGRAVGAPTAPPGLRPTDAVGTAPPGRGPGEDGGLGRPWQWAAALLVATAIAGGWWLQGRPDDGEAGDGTLIDRRLAVETVVSAAARATRLAGSAAGATRAPARGTPARAGGQPTGLAGGARASAAAPAPTADRTEAAAPATDRSGGAPPAADRPTDAATSAGQGDRSALLAAPAPTGPLLRGMGYNPTYATADVAPSVRSDLLGRDLRLMASLGVNMVLGWEPGVFDERLLAAARANDVSVIMPFDLKPEWDYSDPELRLEVLRNVVAWVARYRDDPAVVMWGLGNEVTLEMGDAERRAFAEFYVDAFELVRALDPSRPVILREAEDVFAPYLAEAFARRGRPVAAPADPVEVAAAPAEAEPTPTIVAPEGFVYGVNFYTDRIGPALTSWVENTGLDVPLLVSEYAPAGMSRAQRPGGFAHMYGLIQSAGPRVIGSAPYTWTTAGPEAVDAYFGLVDAEGRAVDATAAQIARMYGVRPPTWTRWTGESQELASAADLPRLLGEAVLAAADRTELSAAEILAAVDARAGEAEVELGVPTPPATEADQRRHEVARLVGWARELSEIRGAGGSRLFPGMREALPLLKGMTRWAGEEQSAVDTAKDFAAAVLRRDLAVLGAKVAESTAAG